VRISEELDASDNLGGHPGPGAIWQSSIVAAQPKLGLLPQRRNKLGLVDFADFVFNGTTVTFP
jgi:hypothetical protein